MATRGTAQLSFVSITQSDAWIARETGIPRSTIGFARRGDRDLPAQYETAMRALYQREAYTRMKEIGFSAPQANRFRSYAPSTVLSYMREVSNKIEELSYGLAIRLKSDDESSGIIKPLSSYLDESRESITKGFQHSLMPKEEWDKYATRPDEIEEPDEE